MFKTFNNNLRNRIEIKNQILIRDLSINSDVYLSNIKELIFKI